MFCGVGVRKYLIDFPSLQRDFVALVFQADNEFLGRFHGYLVEIALDLELFTSDAMSFIPVYLRQPSHAIRESDSGNTLSLPPPAATVELAQTRDFPNGGAGSKGLDMGDSSYDLKVHQPMLSDHRDVVKLPSNVSR